MKIDPENIGVVTPYIGQLNKLKEKLDDNFKNIGSVDTWQGRESDYIVFSTVRSTNLGFLQNPNRMNVALSRARHGLILLGNTQTLCQDDNWREYVNYLYDNDAVVENCDEAIERLKF